MLVPDPSGLIFCENRHVPNNLFVTLQINRFTGFSNDYSKFYTAYLMFYTGLRLLPTYEKYVENECKYEPGQDEMKSVYYTGITQESISNFNNAVEKINTAISRQKPRDEIVSLMQEFSVVFLPSNNPKEPEDVVSETLSKLYAAIAAKKQDKTSINL